MRIDDPIIAPYSIVVDEDCFQLAIEKKYGNEGQHVQWQNATYHSSLKSLLEKLIKIKLSQQENVTSLQSFYEKYIETARNMSLFLDQFSPTIK